MPLNSPLTEAKLKNLTPKDKSYKVFDGKGLYIEVYPNGSKLWRVKYIFETKERRISLGAYPEISLKAARDKHLQIRSTLREGQNPVCPGVAPLPQGATFRQVADDWAARFLVPPQKAPATIKKARLFLDKHVLPALGDALIKDIDPPTILTKLLRPIESRGQLETAHRTKSLCSRIFRFAIATGQADRDPTQDLRGAVPPPVVKHRASFTEPGLISGLLKNIHNYSGHVVTCHALKLLPYVFVRPGELRHAEWSEIDWKE